ncbi:MAG: hypothetical protein R3D00_07590 [Bacteroidia bacterium]
MRHLTIIFLIIQIGNVHGSEIIKVAQNPDTIDNWQVYIDNQLLHKSNEVANNLGLNNEGIKVRLSAIDKEIKIYFGGCFGGIPHYVKMVDKEGNEIGLFQNSLEGNYYKNIVSIPKYFLEKIGKRRIILYELREFNGPQKYKLIELEIE